MFTGVKFKLIAAIFFLAAFLKIAQAEDDRGWFPFYVPWNYCEGSKIDVSFLLDAPAGKHGFLTVKDGHFYFEDGVRARFWGLNIHSGKACFPTQEQAEDIAKRLAQLGCNIVRMHLLDYESPYGIIDDAYEDSQHFSASQMDKLDYFIYQLKQNGIYICFDVLGLGARKFKSGDNVPQFEKIKRGAKAISFFDKRIIELGKKFAKEFLSHINPYTGKTYLDEPAVAMVEMTNENTLFCDGLYKNIPSYYKAEINELWKNWLKEKGVEPGQYGKDCFSDKEFLFNLQSQYQKNIYEYLRSIGVKVPIGGSNMPCDNFDLAVNANMDFTDTHPYWDLCDELDRIHNRPLIMQSHLNEETIVNNLSIAKVRNKPLISTEWGSNWPNDWRAVDILTTASYAALNDWDALFLYAYNGGWGMGWDDLEKKLYYGTVVFNDPAKMGLFSIAAMIFLRGDIKEAYKTYSVYYDINQLFEMNRLSDDSARLAGIGYISKVEKDFNRVGRGKTETGYPSIDNLHDDKVISDTGEIIRDYKKGIFVLRSQRTFSFSGFVGRDKVCEFNGVRFKTEADFAAITITSLDNMNIAKSKHLLLAVVGRVRNKGQAFTPHITKKSDDLDRDVYILNTGKPPILVEDIEAVVFIKKRANKDKGLEVFSLDEKGRRKSEVPVHMERKDYCFTVSGEYSTIYYEILRK